MKKLYFWWHDNFKRPSTWIGLLCLFIGYCIFEDKAIFHRFLENIVSDSDFVKMIIGLISGALIIHKSK